VSGVEFFREYRGSGEIAHPVPEPASLNDLPAHAHPTPEPASPTASPKDPPRIKLADVSVNNLLKEYA